MFGFILAERRLDLSEYPLEVQLNWTRDEKEGKFVLRNAAHKPINVQKVGHALSHVYIHVHACGVDNMSIVCDFAVSFDKVNFAECDTLTTQFFLCKQLLILLLGY